LKLGFDEEENSSSVFEETDRSWWAICARLLCYWVSSFIRVGAHICFLVKLLHYCYIYVIPS